MRNLFLCLCLLVLTTGCMSFNGQELPVRDIPSNVPVPAPLISIAVGEFATLHNGSGGGLKPMASQSTVGKIHLSQVMRYWKKEGLISNWDLPGALDAAPTHQLTISGTQDEDFSTFAAFMTGFTMFLLPSSDTVTYKFHFELVKESTGEKFSVDTKSSITMWQQIVFLPFFPFSIVGTMNHNRDLSRYVYSEFEKQGAWK